MAGNGPLLVADIPAEVLKIFSRDALIAALPQLYFRQFVDVKSEASQPGTTIQFTRLGALPKGGNLATEVATVPKNKYTDSAVTIEVKEYANAIQFSKLAMESSFRNLMTDAATLLGRDYGIVVDDVIRDVYLATANKLYCGGTVSAPVEGSANADVAIPFSTWAVREMVETLKTMNAPMVTRGNSQFYVCVAHPHQLKALRADSQWFDAYKYTSPENIFMGEAGRFEGMVFLETTQMPIIAGAGAGSADVYRAVAFGANAVGFGEKIPFNLVEDGIEDFGRMISIGWYSMFGAGILNDYIVEARTL